MVIENYYHLPEIHHFIRKHWTDSCPLTRGLLPQEQSPWWEMSLRIHHVCNGHTRVTNMACPTLAHGGIWGHNTRTALSEGYSRVDYRWEHSTAFGRQHCGKCGRDNTCLWGMGSHNEESPLGRGLPAGLRHGDAWWTLGMGSATPEWFLETAVSRAGHYQQSWPPMRVGGLWIVGCGCWKGTHCPFCTCSLIIPSLPLARGRESWGFPDRTEWGLEPLSALALKSYEVSGY